MKTSPLKPRRLTKKEISLRLCRILTARLDGVIARLLLQNATEDEMIMAMLRHFDREYPKLKLPLNQKAKVDLQREFLLITFSTWNKLHPKMDEQSFAV